MNFDYIVVGAGFAGATISERIARILGKKVLLIDRRNHIGGNAFDRFDENGVLIHQYGPHIFHTRLEHVWKYLSQFTEWNIYQHKVLGMVDGSLIPIPFNLSSIHKAFPKQTAERLEEKLIRTFGFNVKVPILKLLEEEDDDLRFLADYVYQKVFLNYTLKQWGMAPEEMDPTVTARVPVYVGFDERYFQDKYQAMPKFGYTKMFEKMISHKNISLLLNVDYKEFIEVNFENSRIKAFGIPFQGKLVYTGPIDYFFDYQYGRLPYRSLNFVFENYNKEYYQLSGTVNYPNDYDFTRITEFKHLTGQVTPTTTIVREFPQDYVVDVNLPYYPIKNSANKVLFRKYLEAGKGLAQVLFVGRLAEYQYYDMDAVVSKALKVFEDKIRF